MKIEYIGHAGFIVSNRSSTLICDPWLSDEGAFDRSWFQFPSNHHLFDGVKKLVRQLPDSIYIYISHEHKDHFDRHFLSSIVTYQPKIIIPKFSTNDFVQEIERLGFDNIVQLDDDQSYYLESKDDSPLEVKLYIDDNGINRDSAILVRDKGHGYTFLNLNDCKIFDRLQTIRDCEGRVDIFAVQFSGATWHPTCYSYSDDLYQKISKKKKLSKFISVLNAIKTLEPRRYFPSAGPVSFLDPELLHINFEETNIFPHQVEVRDFLTKRLDSTSVDLIMPGDIYDLKTGGFARLAENRVESYEDIRRQISEYAQSRQHLFDIAERTMPPSDIETVFYRLKDELALKLSLFNPSVTPIVKIYYSLGELAGRYICIDFQANSVSETDKIPDDNFYHHICPAWQVKRVLDRKLTWEDFSLTFRVKIRRNPDLYDTMINGFFFSEAKNLGEFVKKIETLRENRPRINITVSGVQYEIDKYCPHQGANLEEGYENERGYWVCPRHRWEYDVQCGGKCTTSNDTIHSIMALDLGTIKLDMSSAD